MDTRIILFAAGALVMAACSSNDPEVQGATEEIRLYTEVTTQTRAADDPTALQDAQFAENTDISVMVTDKADDNKVHYNLETYRANGSGGLTPVVPQYYPASGSNVDVCAYHPAGVTATFSVAADQRAPGDYRASDLMWAELTDINKNTSAEGRTLHFKHLCSKILVRLVKGNGVTDAEIAAATIKLEGGDGGEDDLNGLIMGGLFATGDGELSADFNNRGTITLATNAGTATHVAVVIPQQMGGKKITVSLGGGTQSYIIPADTEFKKGTKYAYTVTVNKAELVVTATIEDWTTPDGWVDPTPNIKI